MELIFSSFAVGAIAPIFVKIFQFLFEEFYSKKDDKIHLELTFSKKISEITGLKNEIEQSNPEMRNLIDKIKLIESEKDISIELNKQPNQKDVTTIIELLSSIKHNKELTLSM